MFRPSPLVLSLAMDPESFARTNAWRTRYYPANRNYLTAHITLYHSIPGTLQDWSLAELKKIAEDTEAFPLEFQAWERNSGYVGIKIEETRLLQLKARLDDVFRDHLLLQDKQRLKPHVTVTNKVTLQEAKLCAEELARDFVPWTGEALGFHLAIYRKGPWEALASLPFRR